MKRRDDASERTCVVTRKASAPAGLIRFVLGPGAEVVPDLAGKLPGRGVWVTGRRDVVEEAVRKRLFARGFKTAVTADAGLPDLVDRLLAERALRSLSMARKAGRVVTGFGKVTTALGRGGVVAVVHATEAADDGRRKVMQAMSRRARMIADRDADDDLDESGLDDDDSLDDEFGVDGNADETAAGRAEPRPLAAGSLPKVIGGLFSGAELDLALGGPNVIHAALLAGGVSTSFLNNAAALVRYRGGQPETDWMAGIPGLGDPGDPRHDRSFQRHTAVMDGVDTATGED